MTQEETALPNQTQVREANIYTLSGKGIQVTFFSTGLDGQPSLSYHDTHLAKTFKGEEIRLVPAENGQLASVSRETSTDLGYTSFTLLVPRVNLIPGQNAHITTLGITGTHRLTITTPALGQLDSYEVTRFSGTASYADF
ncbi:hypothetical protein [Arthrobacter sp. TE12232]